MTSPLQRLAESIGLQLEWTRPGEARVECREDDFFDLATALSGPCVIGDLFATTLAGSPPRLTAVFAAAGDPAWLLLTTTLHAESFTSLTPALHAASWYEREIFEMHGLEPLGHPALSPLRLHDWQERHHPMRRGFEVAERLPHPPHGVRRPSVTGQGVFQLPLGPVRSGPQESAEFLFSSGGEDIVEVDIRLGFKYRAMEARAEGLAVEDVALLAERVAGVSSFANGLGFITAVENALGVEVGPTDQAARTLLAELERLHHHLGVIGRLAEATGLLVASAQYGILKEEVLRTGGRLTGHRYLRGALRVGGLHARLDEPACQQLRTQLEVWRTRAERLRQLLEHTATFRDRLEGTAILNPGYAAEHSLVGPVGRGSGIDRDCRRDHPYQAYGAVEFQVPTEIDGDAEARFRVHAREVGQSLSIMLQLLDRWRDGERSSGQAARRSGSALGWAEAPGGETLHWVEIDQEGRVVRWRARTPAVVNWHPYAHACGSGNNLTDYPVIEASFSLSAAEFDR